MAMKKKELQAAYDELKEENEKLKHLKNKLFVDSGSEIAKLKEEIVDLKKPKELSPYFKLQKKCGELGLKAVGKKEVLIKRIEEHEQKKKEAAAMEVEKAIKLDALHKQWRWGPEKAEPLLSEESEEEMGEMLDEVEDEPDVDGIVDGMESLEVDDDE